MSSTVGFEGPAGVAWVAEQRKWATGWRRTVFPSVFLVSLVQTGAAISDDSRGLAAIAGYLILGAFCAVYPFALRAGWNYGRRRFWVFEGVLTALCCAETLFAHADAFEMFIFVAVIAVAQLGGRAAPLVVVMTAIAVLVPPIVPSWHDTIEASVHNGTAISIPIVGLAMFSLFGLIHGNRALAEARSEVARLAAENERSRIARDLHDLLGQSLTTITVKAELARRLAPSDLEGALREIGEVEGLSRRALADVRSAVANYREVTLNGELATGQELLRAAGIEGRLPQEIEIVDPLVEELFGWVVREGLTNVVRHSRARTCTVTISPSRVEIVDDGVAGTNSCGNGLSGLRERVEELAGTLEVGPAGLLGWRLLVNVGETTTRP